MTTTPDALIADARNYATNAVGNAITEMNFAMSALGALTAGGLSSGGVDLKIAPPTAGDPGTPPVYAGSKFSYKDFTGVKPTVTDPGSMRNVTTPGYAPAIEAYNPPQQPSITDPDPNQIIGAVPTLTEFTVPDAPDLLGEIHGIAAPALLAVTIPDAPTLVQPNFDGVRPLFTATPPTGLDTTLRTQYDNISPLMRTAVTEQFDAFLDSKFPSFRTGLAAIESRLSTYLAGGSALSPATENALYQRTQDKTTKESNRQGADAWGKAARAGFTIPSPTLLSIQADIEQARRDANNRASIEIYIKQAELEQANLQFAVTQSGSLRKMAVDAGLAYYSGLVQINSQALEYSRSVVDSIVKAYDIAARYAETQARLYETDARVYEARLKAALAVLEAYQARIRGIEAQVQVNVQQVNVYRARIEAVQAEANVYRARIDAMLGQASIEREKVALYSARTQAYAARVSGDTARWQGYEAAVRGEAAKVSASAEPVRAYAARVQAYGEEVRAAATEIETKTRVNEAKVHQYATEVQAYSALNQAQATAIKAEIESFGATIQGFMAKANAISEKSRAEIASYEAGMRSLIAAAENAMAHLRETNRINVARAEGTANVAVAAGNVFGRLAESAMSGMNTLAAEITTAAT